MTNLQTTLANRWFELPIRERVLASFGIVLLVLALLWWLGISPALAKIKQAQLQAPQLDAQLQSMRAQAQEAAKLKGQRQVGYEESVRSLEVSIKTLGPGAQLSVNDSRATVTLKSTNADAFSQWLAQVRSNARLIPSEMKLRKSSEPASENTAWDGTVLLTLPPR